MTFVSCCNDSDIILGTALMLVSYGVFSHKDSFSLALLPINEHACFTVISCKWKGED